MLPRPHRPRLAALLCLAVVGVLAGRAPGLQLLSASATSPSATERVSVDSVGAEGNGSSGGPSISADGRYVAFVSSATNLVPGDTNGVFDVFVHDRVTGTSERVSVDSVGVQANNQSSMPSISGDGRYVAFNSSATNLVPGDTNGVDDVFVHDRVTGATERVSVDTAGLQANAQDYAYNYAPSISADGRYVAFESYASNLVPGDTNGIWDIFVHDRVTAATERVSVDSPGAQGNGNSYGPSISADGRYVVFESSASNLVPGDTNGAADVFVRDRATGATGRVSVDSAGAQGNYWSSLPSISADGRYVTFDSSATNLVPGDTNSTLDVFVHDRVTGATERESVDSAMAQGNGYSDDPAISADGRYVAFHSWATNLVPGDTNATWDIFVHDRVAGTTQRVSADSADGQGNRDSYNPSISDDGRSVAFESNASNLVPGDTNGFVDAFVRDRCADGSCVGPPTSTATTTTAATPTTTATRTITPTVTPTITPTATPTISPTAISTITPTPIPCGAECLLAGFWHVDFTDLGTTGNCSMTVTQPTLVSPFDNTLSCTIVPLATGHGSVVLPSREVTGTATFSDGEVVTASGRISLDGNTITGTWCTPGCTYNGAMTWTRIPASYFADLPQDVGGSLSTALGDTLTVPPNALPTGQPNQTLTIALEPLPVAPPPGYGSLRTAYEFGPSGLTFNSPLTVTAVFHYSNGDIPPEVRPENLRVYLLQGGVWSFVGGTVDTGAMTVTVQLLHFSTYGIFVQLPAAISVGGVAEEPDVTTLRSRESGASREHRSVYGLAGIVGVLAFAAAGWWETRRRRRVG
jgi:Tol biopolymer transport system component